MLTAGWFSNSFRSDGDKRSDNCACAHEHTVSGPNVDQHSGTYLYSDECAHHHVYAYEFAYANFDAVGHCLHLSQTVDADTYELAYAVTDTAREHSRHPIQMAHASTSTSSATPVLR